MSDQPTQGLVKPIDLGNRNLMGLRPAQASLYKYLKKCSDEGKTVVLEDIAEIYFKEVRHPEGSICPRCGPSIQIIKNKEWNTAFKHDYSRYGYFVKTPVKIWMQQTIGSLVMRGLLTVIPNLETQITQDDKSSPDRD